MTVEDIIKYLRLTINVQDPDGATSDSAYLTMTDEELTLYLTVAMYREFPKIPSLNLLPTEYIYAVVLLARKDLYYTLATLDAPLYDLGADNNNYLKRSQRFDHYMKLIQQADKEYNDYLDNGGTGRNTLTSSNVYLPNRYNTRYNYEGGVIPSPFLYVNTVGKDFVDVFWECSFSRFGYYRLYCSEEPIIDNFRIGSKVINPDTLLMTIRDIHQTTARIEGLKPDTEYYIAVGCTEMSSLTGYAEVSFHTEIAEEGEP